VRFRNSRWSSGTDTVRWGSEVRAPDGRSVWLRSGQGREKFVTRFLVNNKTAHPPVFFVSADSKEL